VQKLLSYSVGWLTVFGWQVGLASVSYAAALQIQSLVVLVNPGVSLLGWHVALMTIAIALIAVGFNTILVSKLPTFEFVALVARKSQLVEIDAILQ
jgi:choline transport protein